MKGGWMRGGWMRGGWMRGGWMRGGWMRGHSYSRVTVVWATQTEALWHFAVPLLPLPPPIHSSLLFLPYLPLPIPSSSLPSSPLPLPRGGALRPCVRDETLSHPSLLSARAGLYISPTAPPPCHSHTLTQAIYGGNGNMQPHRHSGHE